MVMLRSFTCGYRSRIFRSQVEFILIIDSCGVIFVINIDAPMCILVGECPPLGDFRLTILARWKQKSAWNNKPI
jgi:hypothetical protein